MASHTRSASAASTSSSTGQHARTGSTVRSGHSQHAAVTFKILVLGDSAVGKTCIIGRAVFGDERAWSAIHSSTVGVDMQKKELHIGDKLVKLQIWDTAGQERFRSIAANYYRGAHGVIVCYDVTRKESFRNVKRWLETIAASTTGDCELLLVANKVDLVPATTTAKAAGEGADGAAEEEGEDARDTVLTEEGEELASSLGIPFYSTSAFTGQNIEEAFIDLAQRMFATYAKNAGIVYSGITAAGSGPGRPSPLHKDITSTSSSSSDGSNGSGGRAPGRPDWRREASELNINDVERRGLQLHKEREAAAARSCSC